MQNTISSKILKCSWIKLFETNKQLNPAQNQNSKEDCTNKTSTQKSTGLLGIKYSGVAINRVSINQASAVLSEPKARNNEISIIVTVVLTLAPDAT